MKFLSVEENWLFVELDMGGECGWDFASAQASFWIYSLLLSTLRGSEALQTRHPVSSPWSFCACLFSCSPSHNPLIWMTFVCPSWIIWSPTSSASLMSPRLAITLPMTKQTVFFNSEQKCHIQVRTLSVDGESNLCPPRNKGNCKQSLQEQ